MFYFLVSFILPFLRVSFSFLLPFLSAFPSFFLSLGFLLLSASFPFCFSFVLSVLFFFFPVSFPFLLCLCPCVCSFSFSSSWETLAFQGFLEWKWFGGTTFFYPRDILGTHHHGKKLNGLWGKKMLRHPGPLGNRRSEAAAADAFALLPSRLSAAARGHAVRHQCIGSVLVGPWRTHVCRTHVCRTHVWTWLLAIKHRNGHFRV